MLLEGVEWYVFFVLQTSFLLAEGRGGGKRSPRTISMLAEETHEPALITLVMDYFAVFAWGKERGEA